MVNITDLGTLPGITLVEYARAMDSMQGATWEYISCSEKITSSKKKVSALEKKLKQLRSEYESATVEKRDNIAKMLEEVSADIAEARSHLIAQENIRAHLFRRVGHFCQEIKERFSHQRIEHFALEKDEQVEELTKQLSNSRRQNYELTHLLNKPENNTEFYRSSTHPFSPYPFSYNFSPSNDTRE